MNTIVLNMDPKKKDALGHTAAYWQRDAEYVWTRKDPQDPDKTISSKPGARLIKYRDFELATSTVSGVAQRYDGNSSIKLVNGDSISIDLPRIEVRKMLGMKTAKKVAS